jgi:outer membrane lipoprotein-sorting protein
MWMTAMRKLYALAFCLLAVLTTARPMPAQDVNKIVDQWIKASGGGKALSRVQTLKCDGVSTSADGKNGTFTFAIKRPNRFYTELRMENQPLIEAYNGKSAWHETRSAEIATLVGADGTQLEAAAQFYNTHLLHLKRDKLAVVLVGSAEVQGKNAWHVQLTSTAGAKRALFFDLQSHLLVKEAAITGGVNVEMYYSDFRTVDGIRVPFKIELHREKDVYQIVMNTVLVNGTVGERTFDFPIRSQVQLPDLKALFKEIDDNQKAIDKLKENYAGTRIEEGIEPDEGKGKQAQRREYTFFYLNGQEVSTLVKKDGKPLSDEEQRKENEKTQKEIQEIQKREEKKEAKDEKAKEEGKKEKEDDDVGIETFLRTSQFVNPRRERFRGQDVLVFDFEPNPEYKARNLVERLVQKLAGVVWIDEKAHDVARLEAYFVGDMRIGGGLLANLQKGTSFVFEQAFINNEVWLPTYNEAHVGVRVLLVKAFKVNEVTRYSDYKKFNVDTLSTVANPKGAATPTSPVDPKP